MDSLIKRSKMYLVSDMDIHVALILLKHSHSRWRAEVVLTSEIQVLTKIIILHVMCRYKVQYLPLPNTEHIYQQPHIHKLKVTATDEELLLLFLLLLLLLHWTTQEQYVLQIDIINAWYCQMFVEWCSYTRAHAVTHLDSYVHASSSSMCRQSNASSIHHQKRSRSIGLCSMILCDSKTKR